MWNTVYISLPCLVLVILYKAYKF